MAQGYRKDILELGRLSRAHLFVNNGTDWSNRSDGASIGELLVHFHYFRVVKTASEVFLEFSGYRRMPNAFPDEISVQTVAKRAR